jgi:hypothetical protein
MSTLTINGVDRWALMQQESLHIEDQLNARNVCEFSLIDQAGTARPLVGQVVVLTIDGTVRFAGTIDSFRERNITSRFANTYRSYAVRCVDFNQYCDRHIVAAVWENVEMVDIIRSVATTYLYTDGVTVDVDIPDGPTIEYYASNYITVAKVFDDLSEMTGYFWYIDYDKMLHFIDRTTMVAPYALNQSTPVDLVQSLDIEHTRAQYRNVQYIRGGQAVTDLTIDETFKGDAETKTFVVSLPIASVPTVSTDVGAGYVVRTVGIRQVDTGYDWYWQESSNEISQDQSGTVLGATHKIKVSYYGYYPLIDAARVQTEVTNRIAVEGGSGLYETIEYRDDITDASLSNARAEGLLSLFGEIQTRVKFSTYSTGWQAGQILSVDRAEHDVTENFIISQVTLQHDGLSRYKYEVTAASGTLVENWVSFFKRMAEDNRHFTRRANEVVNLLRLFYEDVTIEEVFATPTSPASVLGEVLTNQTLIGSSAEKNYVGFGVIGDLLQTINYVTPRQSLPLGMTDGNYFVRSTGVASQTYKLGLLEVSTLTTVTP